MRRAPAILVGLLALWGFAGDLRAQGQETGPQMPLEAAVVAVIDYQRLLRESAAARSIRSQVQEQRDIYEAEVEAERRRLAEADRLLAEQRDDLEPEVFRERRRAFEQDVAEVQRLVQERRRELDAASSRGFQRIRDTVVQVIDTLSDSYRFNLVLPRSDVLVFAPELDLTMEVMARLNERLPEVTLSEFEE